MNNLKKEIEQTKSRKLDHIKLAAENTSEVKKSAGFNNVEFVHNALPEIDFDSIDLSTKYLGHDFKLPLFISGMTGGHKVTEQLNKNLAKSAQETGIGMGVGSQRAMVEDPSLTRTYQVRDSAPTILLLGNLGVFQMKEYGVDKVRKAIEDIDANALAVHLNPLQEVIQSEGDTDHTGFLEIITTFCRDLDYPILVKETGAGISKEVAQSLIKAGVQAIDVGGCGGTSFSKVEAIRAGKDIDEGFAEWGIPTAASILEIKSLNPNIQISATGGIRSGLDAAKAIALGADVACFARPLMDAAKLGSDKVVETIEKIADELRTAMFLVGAQNIEELRTSPLVINGYLKEWIENRKLLQ